MFVARFNVFNFPDSHFFVYLRGGDGDGHYKHITDDFPGIDGGVAFLYPYVQSVCEFECALCGRRVTSLRACRHANGRAHIRAHGVRAHTHTHTG